MLTLFEGTTFCVGEPGGDVEAGDQQGLFVRDTRVLSQWSLTVDGTPPQALSVEQDDPFAATSVSRVAAERDSKLLVVRRRAVGDGMREDVSVRNLLGTACVVELELALDADFADLFEVRRASAVDGGAVERRCDAGSVRLQRRRFEQTYAVTITADGGARASARGLSWRVELPAHGEWITQVQVVPEFDGVPLEPLNPLHRPVDDGEPARRLREWRKNAPRLHTADPVLAAVWRRSVDDLGSLRIHDPLRPARTVVAAGAPWYMALFGRDSLLTSWMLLPLDTELALGTLEALAEHQGSRTDPRNEEQPGKIPHELRFGPATHGDRVGRGVYYGTADATPLFVMLLGELTRWTGFSDRIRALLPYADRALEWITGPGDPDGDGFVEYERTSPSGLRNQGWKDSPDAINYADGRLAVAPLALCEVQAYCYAAMRARAELARYDSDGSTAERWTARADELRRRFNERFWLPGREWYAVGLGPDKEPVDALTSNMGHCLWTGIADDDKAASVARHLASSELSSGWGIRTLARSMPAYNPLSYHNGSVWPHDTALCVDGLVRYGFIAEAQRIATDVLAAAAAFGHRPPELYGGFDRAEFAAPVPYPTACSPQAWSAAAPIQLVRSLLRLEPDAATESLRHSSVLPPAMAPLRLDGVRVGARSVTVDIDGIPGGG